MAIINGNDASNQLNGTNLADQIFGLGGNDALEGLDGNDLLEGGAGIDDQYGGNGFDYASYRSSGAGVRVYLNLGYGLDGDAQGDGLYDIEGVIGSAHADILFGKDDCNVLRGGDGNDTLVGFGGDDELEGGFGADELVGDNGFDYASYKSSPTGVVVNLDGSGHNVGGHAQGDHLYSIEGVVGSAFADFIYGDDQRNVLRGGGGNDFLSGGPGNDQLQGGAGNDSISYADTSEGVVVDLAAGTATGGASIGSDHLSSIENVGGTYYNDRLTGTEGANRLAGLGGADVLAGGGGADRFVYGQTSDSLPATPDRILDFSRSQGDRIDLVEVDANAQVTGDQTFKFIGKNAFTGAGQLRYFQQNGDTIVEANTTDLTAGPEMRIVLDPLVSLQAGDFFL
jgi:Ca2+-binding RTX toxin-like protein